MLIRRTFPVLATFLLLAAAPASAMKTHQLHILAYCAPGSYCGYPSKQALTRHFLDTVQEMNLQWEFMEVSFRPKITIIEDNYYSEVMACNKDDLSKARRTEWQDTVAVANTNEIRIMVTEGGNWCCANIPGNSDTFNEMFGLFCFAGMEARTMGGLWAHEMGHYWCLPHTMKFEDSADSAPDPPDWDYDDCCNILDTPADPGRREGYAEDEFGVPVPGKDNDVDGNAIVGHEWCSWNELTPEQAANILTDDSPHDTKCTWGCWQQQNGQTNPILGLTTWERAVMSYFGLRCYGPYVLTGGTRREGFSTDQKTKVASCSVSFPAVRNFPDVCANRGGDTDSDGICDLDDNCPLDKNTSQVDTDGDGDPDGCDLCPEIPGPHGDIDGDGVGDECDADKDGDGCDNDVDQNPGQNEFQVGSQFSGCGFGTEGIVGYEQDDTDMDGVINCLDLDDDNDGICDQGGPYDATAPGVPPLGCIDDGLGFDTCPHTPGQFSCFFQGSPLDCPPDWITCLGTTCAEFFLKWQNLINPAEQLIVPDFQIIGRTIYAARLPGFTLSELAQVAQGNFAVTGLTNEPGTGTEGTAPEAGHGDPVQLEIWSKTTNRLVAIVGQYDSSLITLGDIDRGRFLALTPVMDETGRLSEMRIASTYGRRDPDEESALPDTDGDGRPDFFDRCKLVPDFGQRDTDGDGFGNACDPDIDQDLLVTAADVAAIEACEGADLTIEQPVIEPLDGTYGLEGDEAEPPDPAAVLMAVRCRAMDLNGDLRVDPTDTAIATAMLGLPPGPSAFTRNTNPCGTLCDDGVDCTHDYCDATTGQCVSVPTSCDDGDVCTIDTCDVVAGCLSTPLDCDDGNPCTDDRCDPTAGGCSHDPLPNRSSCDDENLCTRLEFCDNGLCGGGTPTICDDGDPCTLDVCDPGTGQCTASASACDDGNDCTEDLCGAGGCENIALTGDLCDDGDACTQNEVCRSGECGGGASVDCDDGDACTVDACDVITGCTSAPLDCDDGNDCTEDLCDPAQGSCINPPVTVGDPGPIAFLDQGTIQWPFTQGPKHWNMYRGTIPANGMGSRPAGAEYDHVCFESADFHFDGPTTTRDYMIPPLGTAFYYAATEEVTCVEGTPGTDAAGVQRPLLFPCLTPP